MKTLHHAADLAAPIILSAAITTAAAAWWPIATSPRPSMGALIVAASIIGACALTAKWSLRRIQRLSQVTDH